VYGLPAALPFLRLGETVYREPHPPRALGAGAARVALRSLVSVDAEATVRRARAAQLAAAAAAAGIPTVTPIEGAEPGYLRFPLVLGSAAADVAARSGRLGIARAYPRTLAQLPALATRCRNVAESFPGATQLAAALYTAPTHSYLTDNDLAQLVTWIAALPGRMVA
jgi:dTDP-4-amino-4,6-dideoxygalactose transaminase